MIQITLEGDAQLRQAVAELGAQALPVASASLYRDGNAIIADAKANYVPVDFGALRGSGFADMPKTAGQETTVEIGFGGPSAPYALAVHENPRAGRTFGLGPVRNGKQVHYKHFAQVGMWKYLQTPLMATANSILEHLAESLEEAVTAMGRS